MTAPSLAGSDAQFKLKERTHAAYETCFVDSGYACIDLIFISHALNT